MPRHFRHQPRNGRAFNIGRVTEDQIEPPGQRRCPIPSQEARPIREGEPRSIPRCQRCRFGLQINANANRGGEFTQHCQQQGPRTGAEVQHLERRALVRAGCQRRFHQGFAIRARNERGGGDFEFKRPEANPPGQIGEGLMRDAPCQQGCEMRGLIGRHRRARVAEQRFFRCAQYMREQAARFEPRCFNRRAAQPLARLTKKKANRAGGVGAGRVLHAASAASRAAWSSAISASNTSSNSPSITRSILCSVKPMR